jgi:hypothetical protein
MAPGASGIMVYEAGSSGDWHDILNRMTTDNLAKQLSCSWYIPGGAADPVADQIFQQMAAQGQTFLAASGDSDAYTGLIPFPGDTPYITEVGGTTLTTNGAGGAWASETVWNWDDNIGSSGGVSTQYAIPSWQQGINMTASQGSTTMRNTPDVALTANNVYVRADGVDQNVGGTSCAAPLWAAFIALVNQQALANNQTTVGFINPAIYAAGTGSGYANDFHDISTGNNFSSSSPSKFSATAGYDLCTGWGTPAGTALINTLAPPGPVIATSSPLPNGTTDLAYNQTLAATGGSAPYTWSISSGNLPQGLNLSNTGVISGTPGAAGTSSFTVQVTDNKGNSSTMAFGLTIYTQGTPTITTGSPLPSGTLSAAYNQTLAAGGGATPYTWSISSGNLPSGVALSTAGVISGTPVATGTSSFIVQVTGNDGLFSTSPFSMAVNPAPVPPAITTASPLTPGTAGTTYNQTLTATGGKWPYTWSVSSGSLPTGLALSSGGIISGTAATPGSFNFTVQATGTDGLFSTQAFTLVIYPQGTLLNSSFETGNFTGWVASDLTDPFVPLQVRANGFSPGYGLFPCVATDGTYSATAGFDGSGPGTIQVAQDISVPAGSPYLTFDYRVGWDMLDYPGSTIGRTLTVTVQPSGGGATLASNLELTAIPGTKNLDTGSMTTAVDLSAFAGTNIRVCFDANIPQVFTGPAFFEVDNVRLLPVSPPIIAIATPPPSAWVGTPYNYALSAGGGFQPYIWSVVSGGLPTGLSLSSAGVIGGTPVSSGTSYFTLQVAGNNGSYSRSALSIVTYPPGTPAITTVSPLPPGFVSATYNQALSASGGATPYFWSIYSGALPSGLSLNSSGVIYGTPASSGTFGFFAKVAGSNGAYSTKAFTLTVTSGPVITTASTLPPGWVGQPYSQALTASGGAAPYSWSITSGSLPAGLALGSNGLISGTPLSTANSNFVIQVTDNNGVSSTAAFALSTAVPPNPPVITSGTTVSGTQGHAFSYQIAATNTPASYAATGLPMGLGVNTASGLISGTPTGSGTTSATITATNPGGTGSATLVITVQPAPPAITSGLAATGTNGFSFSYQIAASFNPGSYEASGLPAGLNVDTIGGVISGTPTVTGTSNVTISATNPAGSGSATLVISVLPPPPSITSGTIAPGTQGQAFSYQIAATNNPTSYGATGLPTGLGVNTASGLISGTPAGSGTIQAIITATNGSGTGSAPLVITLQPSLPVITGNLTAPGVQGAAFSYQITATNIPTSYGASGLPAGLNVNTASGLINGTPSVTGTSDVTISATNPAGSGTAALVITITLQPPPVITSATSAIATEGSAFNYQITATQNPNSFGASGLPPGLGINTSSGLISGTSSVNGTFQVTLSASGTSGIGTASLQLAVGPSYYWGNIAGSPGTPGTADGSGTTARFDQPTDVTVDASGNVYVADYTNETIRKLTLSGTSWMVTTIAGSPTVSGTADGTGTSALFHSPNGIGGGSGNLYVADQMNETIRELTPSGTNWVVSTLAGDPAVSGSADGTGTNARFDYPLGVTASEDGNLYVADEENYTIRRLSLSGTNWTAATIAGSAGISGTGDGTGAAARFLNPVTMTSDRNGNLYMVDSHAQTVRELTLSGTSWTVTTIAGSATVTGTNDGMGSAAQFYFPNGIVADGNGVLYVADALNDTVRKMVQSGTSWMVTTIGGSARVSGTANGAGSSARFNEPQGVAVDASGNLYVSNTNTHCITMGSLASVITGPLTATAINGTAFSYQITASGNPNSYSVTGLPSGVTLNTATGLISGTPISSGTYNALVDATNEGGTGQIDLLIEVQAPPSIPAQPLWGLIILALLLLFSTYRFLPSSGRRQ